MAVAGAGDLARHSRMGKTRLVNRSHSMHELLCRIVHQTHTHLAASARVNCGGGVGAGSYDVHPTCFLSLRLCCSADQ